jgi:hypothetical protein
MTRTDKTHNSQLRRKNSTVHFFSLGSALGFSALGLASLASFGLASLAGAAAFAGAAAALAPAAGLASPRFFRKFSMATFFRCSFLQTAPDGSETRVRNQRKTVSRGLERLLLLLEVLGQILVQLRRHGEPHKVARTHKESKMAQTGWFGSLATAKRRFLMNLPFTPLCEMCGCSGNRGEKQVEQKTHFFLHQKKKKKKNFALSHFELGLVDAVAVLLVRLVVRLQTPITRRNVCQLAQNETEKKVFFFFFSFHHLRLLFVVDSTV